MQMLFKQRMFSWFDSYDIYDEQGKVLYTVKGQLSWGHLLQIYDASGRNVGTVKQKLFTWMPKFELLENGATVGVLHKKLTFFRPAYTLSGKDWTVEGNIMEWDYRITDAAGQCVATVGKQLFKWTDTYVIDVADPADALYALMFTLAIDAEKCSRK